MRRPRLTVLSLLACLVLAWIACPCVWSRMLGVASAESGADGAAVSCCCCGGDDAGRRVSLDQGDAPGEPPSKPTCACSRRAGDNATHPDVDLDTGAAAYVGQLEYAPLALVLDLTIEAEAQGWHRPGPHLRPRPVDLRRGTVLLR